MTGEVLTVLQPGGGVWDAWALRRTIMLQAILFCPLVSTQLPHGQAYALKESADIKSKAQLMNKTCGPGRAGDSCQFSLSTVYGKHNPYDGFVPPPKDQQPGWPGLQPLAYQTLVVPDVVGTLVVRDAVGTSSMVLGSCVFTHARKAPA